MSAPISLAKLFRLIPDGSPLDREPERALEALAGLERNRSLYQSMGFSEAVQATDAKIQTLFRPFDRDQYLLRVAAIGSELHSPDESRFSEALRQSQELATEYAPFLLRGVATTLRSDAEELNHQRGQNRMVLTAFEAAATTQVEALLRQEKRDSARALQHELQETLGRLAASLHAGKTPLEAVQAERALHPLSHFVDMYYESGLCDLIPEISRPNAEVWDLLVGYAETLESYGHYSGARVLAEALESHTGAGIHQRASALLNRIPDEALTDERYQFLFNLNPLGFTAESNVAILKMGTTAASFVGANALGRLAGVGTSELMVSTGASEIEAGLSSHLAQTLTIGATQPLMAPGAENLTFDSYLNQFAHLAGLTGALGIRSALMRGVSSSLLQYAGTIGTMTAYDYATEPEIRNLPFVLNLAHVAGNDLLMRSGEILPNPRNANRILTRITESLSSFFDGSVPKPTWFVPAAMTLAACDTTTESIVIGVSISIGALGVYGLKKGMQLVDRELGEHLNSLKPIANDSAENRPTSKISPEMVDIPGGRFVRGSAAGGENTSAAEWVEIRPFRMSKSPVTQDQWLSYLYHSEFKDLPYALFGRNIDSGFDEVLDRGKTAEELNALWKARISNPQLWHYEGVERASGLRKIFDMAPEASDLLKRRINGDYDSVDLDPESFRLLRPLTEAKGEGKTFQSHHNWHLQRVIPTHFYSDGPDHPVGGITYWQALAYADSLGMRLPTAAEWEFATGPSVPIQAKIEAEKKESPLENWAEWIQGPEMLLTPRLVEAQVTSPRWGRFDNFSHGLQIFSDPQDPVLLGLLREGAAIYARRVFPTREGYYRDPEIVSSIYRKRWKTRSSSEGIPNEYGLIDMGGNVRQWVMPESHHQQLRPLRGNSVIDYRPTAFRSRFQFLEDPNIVWRTNGFRIVATE